MKSKKNNRKISTFVSTCHFFERLYYTYDSEIHTATKQKTHIKPSYFQPYSSNFQFEEYKKNFL